MNSAKLDKIFTVVELSEYLHIPEEKIYSLCEKHEIPAIKIAKHWRFKKSVIDEWLELEKWKNHEDDKVDFSKFDSIKLEDEEIEINFLDYFSKDLMAESLRRTKKEPIIDEMIEMLYENRYITSIKEFKHHIMNRENLCSTGVGNGVGLCHSRNINPKIIKKSVLAIGLKKGGVNFNAIDKIPVNIVLVAAFKDPHIYLKVVSKLMLLFNNEEFKNNFLQCNTKLEMYEMLSENLAE